MSGTVITRPEFFGKVMQAWGDGYKDAFDKAAIRGVMAAAQFSKIVAVREIGFVKPRQPIDTGELRRSYRVRMVYLRESNQWAAELINIAPHAPMMEFGTRPHAAPMAALIKWAERKLRVTQPKKARKKQSLIKRIMRKVVKASLNAVGLKGKSRLRSKATLKGVLGNKPSRAQRDRLREAKKLARAAWWSIKQRGTEAREFHKEAEKSFPTIMEGAMRREINKII